MSAKTDRQIYNEMALNGIRIFKVKLGFGPGEETYWIHDNKTTSQWRDDLKQIIKDGNSSDTTNGYANCDVFNKMTKGLQRLGYHELDDVISDVFEGRVTNEKSRIIDDPEHENQKDGFGHYGWDSK